MELVFYMNANKNILGKKLKKLRLSCGLKQDDIAALLKMSRTSFSKYENGATSPPLPVMRKLAALYRVKLEYLIYDDDTSAVFNSQNVDREPDVDEINSFNELTHEEKIMIMKIRLMTSEKKKEFVYSVRE